MATQNSFQCPYCLHHSVIDGTRTVQTLYVDMLNSVHGLTRLNVTNRSCQNGGCRKLSVFAALHPIKRGPPDSKGRSPVEYGEQLHFWRLLPQSLAKPQPDYIPPQIRDDYEEACKIRDLSPKAAATLSRRCLQGMIRDFWGIKKRNLSQAITALKPKIDGTTWKAIEAVRKVGNIGAHMEKDINLIIDVDPKEAGLLIGLIERFFKEWYVAQHERDQSMAALIDMASGKEKARKGEAADVDVEAAPTDERVPE